MQEILFFFNEDVKNMIGLYYYHKILDLFATETLVIYTMELHQELCLRVVVVDELLN